MRAFRDLKPVYCSIYERDFWRVERIFKNHIRAHIVLNGTPFKSAVWRLLGVHLGRRLFDDGGGMAEKNMVTIGDDVTLNQGSIIQCHSQEDYVFKSDRIRIGSGLHARCRRLRALRRDDGRRRVLAPD